MVLRAHQSLGEFEKLGDQEAALTHIHVLDSGKEGGVIILGMLGP